jgi:hypothetical protein
MADLNRKMHDFKHLRRYLFALWVEQIQEQLNESAGVAKVIDCHFLILT